MSKPASACLRHSALAGQRPAQRLVASRWPYPAPERLHITSVNLNSAKARRGTVTNAASRRVNRTGAAHGRRHGPGEPAIPAQARRASRAVRL